MKEMFDVIIIGSGPAGLTAGIYTSRANLKTLVIAGSKWGGQLMLTTLVENYPGFLDGIQGPDLMMNMRKQAEKFGVKIVDEDVVGLNVKNKPFEVNITPHNPPLTLSGGSFLGKSIIIATGAEFNWLGLPSEQKLIGRGVSSCATCDAAFFKDKRVIVVGGGDAAMEEALVLAKFASEVTVVHRRETFRASKIMQDRVLNHPKLNVIWNSVVEEILGEVKVEGVRIKSQILNSNNPHFAEASRVEQINSKSEIINKKIISQNEKEICWELEVDGVFVAIGHNPATKIFNNLIELDEKGFVKRNDKIQMTNDKSNSNFKTMTSVEGVFVAGDVHDIHYKQAVTAAGYGCEAALEVEKWLDKNS